MVICHNSSRILAYQWVKNMGFPGDSVKDLPATQEIQVQSPGSGRCHSRGNGSPLQHALWSQATLSWNFEKSHKRFLALLSSSITWFDSIYLIRLCLGLSEIICLMLCTVSGIVYAQETWFTSPWTFPQIFNSIRFFPSIMIRMVGRGVVVVSIGT